MSFRPLYRDLDPLRLAQYLRRCVEDLRSVSEQHRQSLLPARAFEADGGLPPDARSETFTVDRHHVLSQEFLAIEADVDLPHVEGCCPAIHFRCGRRSEGVLYIDGEIATGIGTSIWDDGEPVWLPELAGGTHNLLLHVERDEGDGAMRPAERSTLECFDAVLMHEATYRLAIAIDLAVELYSQLDETAASRQPIRSALRSVAESLPMHDEQAVRQAAPYILQNLIDEVFSGQETQPIRVGVFGHAHIDLAWLWTPDKSRRKSVRTFASQLRLAERFPWAVFQQGQVPLYDWVREDAPELFDRVRHALASGQFQADGTIFIEPDTLALGASQPERFALHQLWADVLPDTNVRAVSG